MQTGSQKVTPEVWLYLCGFLGAVSCTHSHTDALTHTHTHTDLLLLPSLPLLKNEHIFCFVSCGYRTAWFPLIAVFRQCDSAP